MDIITGLKEDFRLEEKDFNIYDCHLKQKLNTPWDFNWFEYYKNNFNELNLDYFFNELLKDNNDLEKRIFNGNETFYLEKYGNIIQERKCYNKKYTEKFNLADFIWRKFIEGKNLTLIKPDDNFKLENKIKILPFISNIQKKFIFRVFEDDKSLCFEILKFINYQLGKKELMVLYCREEMEYLEKMELQVDDELLQKALAYGRKNVLELLDKRGLLEKHSNPFALDKIKRFFFEDDIWYGWSWGNDECERDIISENCLDECFEMCKKYFEIKDEYFEKWLNLTNSRRFYGPCYSMILPYFINRDDLKSKTKIIQLVKKFGKQNIWDIIRRENFYMLDILLEN